LIDRGRSGPDNPDARHPRRAGAMRATWRSIAMSMSENPYEPPKTQSRIVGIKSGRRDDLRKVAGYQKGILVCILIYLVCVALQFALPANARLFVALGVLVVGVAATVFVFLLSIQVYSTGLGILYAILTMVPCVGLLMLLIINGKATTILRNNGIPVGFLGADLSRIYCRVLEVSGSWLNQNEPIPIPRSPCPMFQWRMEAGGWGLVDGCFRSARESARTSR
jgi:hypothetical protein